MDAGHEAAGQLVQQLAITVAEGQAIEAVALAEKILATGMDVREIVEKGLTAALESLDVKCNNDEFNLLQILLAGRAVMEVMDRVVCPHLDEQDGFCGDGWYGNKGVFVLGTIQGDIHDLGKNIVAILLKMAGYRVIDLGKDVPPASFAAEAANHKAGFIGISSLITTTVHHIKEVRVALAKVGLTEVVILAGGAAARQISPQVLNVDFVADDVFDLLSYLQNLKTEAAK